uniref:Reverse transcriptase Ty1/copia-type domain-containing protein n=1 Tax=Triticum urartu TaxID=4572 RepID=A0A8R7UNS5_TRIUA
MSPSTPSRTYDPDDGWVTPPTVDDLDAEGVPVRFKSMEYVIDHAPECTLEYSGLCLSAAEEPASVEDALDEPAWRGAMEAKMDLIRSNDTWDLASLPARHRAIGLKWVFKVKHDPAGNIVKHKARLVAKVHAQRQGVDFDEVFAPVARLETVRLLLAVTAQ